MKVKLLKKMRKRFSIEFFENGAPCFDEIIKGPHVVLWDAKGSYTTYRQVGMNNNPNPIYLPDAVQELKKIILKAAREDYTPHKQQKLKRITIYP